MDSSSKHTAKVNKMTAQKFAIATIVTLAFLFVILLVLGVVFSSVPIIVAAFVCGFIGFAISDHESQVDYKAVNEGCN